MQDSDKLKLEAMGMELMNKNLLILGAGGHGRVVKETAEAMGCFDKIDFLDDISGSAIGKCADFQQYTGMHKFAFVAFGNNELRYEWMVKLIEFGFKLPTLIHPTAYVSPSATIGEGSIVIAKAAVNANSTIGKGCIISLGALVDHDCHIGECAHINTGAVVKAGSKVERLTKIDAGSIYSGEKKVEEYSFEVGV